MAPFEQREPTMGKAILQELPVRGRDDRVGPPRKDQDRRLNVGKEPLQSWKVVRVRPDVVRLLFEAAPGGREPVVFKNSCWRRASGRVRHEARGDPAAIRLGERTWG